MPGICAAVTATTSQRGSSPSREELLRRLQQLAVGLVERRKAGRRQLAAAPRRRLNPRRALDAFLHAARHLGVGFLHDLEEVAPVCRRALAAGERPVPLRAPELLRVLAVGERLPQRLRALVRLVGRRELAAAQLRVGLDQGVHHPHARFDLLLPCVEKRVRCVRHGGLLYPGLFPREP
jgi:hypothetical protein